MRALKGFPAVMLLAVSLMMSPLLTYLSCAAAHAAAADRELYALIVGVGQYQDSHIPALSRAVKDAKDFHAFLKEREHLFSRGNMTLLIDDQATRANVVHALRHALGKARQDDIVVIYLSGHGLTDPAVSNEFYFGTHDARLDNLFGTALLMNDSNLFRGIKSDNVLLLTDACHSGGFSPGLDRLIAKSATRFFSIFDGARGRIAISSSRPEEDSYEKLMYGNSIFTHFLLKGLRGQAVHEVARDVVTVDDLYKYVHENTRLASNGMQNPQLYAAKGVAQSTPVFVVPKGVGPLEVKAQFFYESDEKEIKALTDDSVLKSGQNLGVAFQSQSDCYAYIFWTDSSGSMGMLFPNPRLTQGTGQIVAGKTYWLPHSDGERWYVLDDKPGTETIYFVASRDKNPKIEEIYQEMLRNQGQNVQAPSGTWAAPAGRQAQSQAPSGAAVPQGIGPQAAQEITRELSLMGFADRTVAKGAQDVSFSSREQIFEGLEGKIRVSGAEAVFKVQFRHVAQ
jgi:hypothetical protein